MEPPGDGRRQARMRIALPASFVVLVVLSACAAPGGTAPDSSPPDSSPSPSGGDGDGIGHPAGSDAILVVDNEGGFVPVEFLATQVPPFVLLGDGRVIMLGPQTLEFPGPALPPLITRQLSESGIQDVLRTVEDTNLFTGDLEFNGAQNFVADAAHTVFTLDAADQQVRISIYGLGTFLPGQELPQGLSSSEAEAHRLLSGLNDALMTLDTWLPADAWVDDAWHPFEPEAFSLHVTDVTGQPIEGGDLPEQVREWPTEDDPATVGEEVAFFGNGTRCWTVEGELGATWFEELSAATQMTLWSTDGDDRWRVLARPILPHEEVACPSLEGAA